MTPDFWDDTNFCLICLPNMGELLRESGRLPGNLKTESLGNTRPIPVISWTQAGHWCEAIGQSGDYDEFVETDSNGKKRKKKYIKQ